MKNQKALLAVIALVAVVAIALAVVFGVQKSDIEKKVSELEAQVSTLTGELDSAKEAAAAAEKVAEEAAAAQAAAEAEAEAAAAAQAAAEAEAEAAAAAAAEAAEAAAAAAAAQTASAEKTTVTVWSTFTDAQDAYMRKMAEEFTASQDQYEVVVETQPNSNFTSNVYTAVVNGEGPDIIFNYASEAAKYVPAGLVANLDEYIYDEEIGIENFDEMLPEYLIEEMNGMEDGHIHWIPGATTGPILFYNKTMLTELGLNVPKTWDELVEVSAAIKAAKPEVLPFGIDSLTDILQTIIMEAGEGYIDVENKCLAFGGEKTVEVLKWYQAQCQAGYFSATAPTGGYFSNDFNTGLVAMYYGSCAGVPYIQPDGFEYDVAPAPYTANGEGAYSIWNRGPIVFHYEANTDREKGAYLFIKYWLADAKNAEGWAEAMGALTPWVEAQKVEGYDAFVASQPALAAVAGNFEIGVSFPSVTGASQVRDAIKELGTTIAGGASVEEALAACVETSNNALQGN